MDDDGSVRPYSDGGLEPEAGRPLILLVHGYNNDPRDAAESYFAMRCNLDNLLRLNQAGKALRKEFQSRMWELYWPGYMPLSRRGSGRQRTTYERAPSSLSYSLEVRKARSWVADGLKRYLTRCAPSEVFFIAHSLGCRVVLETVNRLATSLASRIQLTGFLLMAGAVPVNMLDNGGLLGPSAKEAHRRYCLHSWRDGVLKLAFPPGQVLSGEVPPPPNVWPVATGLSGGPRLLWDLHANTQLNHGGYWREGLFKGRAALSELCAGIFGVAIERGIQLSELPRVLTASKLSILPENQLPSGRLLGSNWLVYRYGPQS
jgi:pimeloyl-ACP methyl ester carboxylesterase